MANFKAAGPAGAAAVLAGHGVVDGPTRYYARRSMAWHGGALADDVDTITAWLRETEPRATRCLDARHLITAARVVDDLSGGTLSSEAAGGGRRRRPSAGKGRRGGGGPVVPGRAAVEVAALVERATALRGPLSQAIERRFPAGMPTHAGTVGRWILTGLCALWAARDLRWTATASKMAVARAASRRDAQSSMVSRAIMSSMAAGLGAPCSGPI